MGDSLHFWHGRRGRPGRKAVGAAAASAFVAGRRLLEGNRCYHFCCRDMQGRVGVGSCLCLGEACRVHNRPRRFGSILCDRPLIVSHCLPLFFVQPSAQSNLGVAKPC